MSRFSKAQTCLSTPKLESFFENSPLREEGTACGEECLKGRRKNEKGKRRFRFSTFENFEDCVAYAFLPVELRFRCPKQLGLWVTFHRHSKVRIVSCKFSSSRGGDMLRW